MTHQAGGPAVVLGVTTGYDESTLSSSVSPVDNRTILGLCARWRPILHRFSQNRARSPVPARVASTNRRLSQNGLKVLSLLNRAFLSLPAQEAGMTIASDTDGELLAAVRAGDTAAYGTLYERHHAAVRQLAYALPRAPAEADDLVAETFARVLATLRAGRGPLAAFRAYLCTTLRHVCYHRARRDRRLEFTDDLTRYDPGEPFLDPALDRLERTYAAPGFPAPAAR